jgi:Deacetylase PdaC/Protein of unknown function (DUF3298)
MKNTYLPTFSALFVAIFMACQQNNPQIKKDTNVSTTKLTGKECTNDTICAEISLEYLQFSGGQNTAAIAAVNDSLVHLALMGIEGNVKLPIQQAFDSAKADLSSTLKEQLKMAPDWAGGMVRESKSRAIWQNADYLSVNLDFYGYTGGAHGYGGVGYATYNLNTGKSLSVTEVVKDTAALVPFLEKAFVAAKNEASGEQYQLADLLFPEFKHLPVPAHNFCISDKGLHFAYNPYEVAAYAIGITEILIKWEEVAALADKSKFVR